MDRYIGLLKWSLVHRWKTVFLGFLAFVATVLVFMNLRSPFSRPRTIRSARS